MASFVGRTAELADLRELAADALRTDLPRIAIVTGLPGSGKSRLLDEAAAVGGFKMRLDGAGYEPERDVPFATGMGLLRAIAARSSDEGRIAGLLGKSGEPLEPLRLFEMGHDAVSKLAPVLITVDDLQWVDSLTAGFLHYLVRAARSEERALVLFAASRPAPQAAALATAFRSALGDPEAVLRLELQPLDEEAGIALVRQVAPRMGTQEARALYERAEGSPFWIEVLAAGDAEDGWSPAAGARLEGLGRDAALLVAALAVAGRPLLASEVKALHEWPAARVESAAAEAALRGVVVEHASELRLSHDLIREAALRDLPAELVRTLHAGLAAELERTASDEDVVALQRALEHAKAAGMKREELAGRIARSPQRRLLGGDGLRALATEADTSSAQQLLLAVAELASELGEYVFAVDRWRTLVDCLPETDAARAALGGAHAALQARDASAAQGFLAKLANVVDPVLTVERDAVEAAIRLWLVGDPAGGQVVASRAAGRARHLLAEAGGLQSASPVLVHAYREALNVAYESAAIQWDDNVAGKTAGEIRAASRTLVEELDAELTIGGYRRRLGHWPEAEEIFRRVWKRSRAAALPEMTMGSGYRLATVLLARGRLDEAEEIAAESDGLGERIGGLAWTRGWFHADWYGTGHHRGDWRRALEQIAERARREPEPHYRSGLTTHLVRWRARLEGAEGADAVAALIERCHAELREAGCPRCKAEFRVTAGEAWGRIGAQRDAGDEIRGWLELYPGASSTMRMRVVRVDGHIAWAAGRTAAALETLRRVVEQADSLGLVIEAIWSRLDLAAVAAEASRDEAEEAFRRAAESADRIGAVTETRIAGRGLRGLGVRTWRRGRHGAGPTLTEREQEIAGMVVSGASNPEIASTLFLSRKTVERHISNILAKTGARNRTELAGRLTAAAKD